MDFNAILTAIAKEHNTTQDQVKADMEEAIAAAKDLDLHSKSNNSPRSCCVYFEERGVAFCVV